MKINDLEALDKACVSARAMVNKRAVTSGLASAVPGALVGASADVALLMNMLPQINRMFGLDPEQIDELDEQGREQVTKLIGTVGSQLIGRAITKEVIVAILKAVGLRGLVKNAATFVPFVGSAVGGAMGYGMMRYVGNRHIDECYNVVRDYLDARSKEEGAVLATA